MNGMSATTSASRRARAAEPVNRHMSSMVTGTVLRCPIITMPALSPTSMTSMPARSHSEAIV